MKFKFSLITLIAIVLLNVNQAKAQNTNFSVSHLKAAETYLVATGINTQLGDVVENMINASSAQIPADKRSAFVGVMKTFFAKYYNWETLKDKMSHLYAAEFTEDELSQMTAFYNTPVGKKASSKMALLAQKGIAVGQEVATAHRPELEQMMKDAFEKPQPAAKQ